VLIFGAKARSFVVTEISEGRKGSGFVQNMAFLIYYDYSCHDWRLS